jgi:chromosome segregation ATPase
MFSFRTYVFCYIYAGGEYMAFKVNKDQLTLRDALAADLRAKADALNATIAAYNREIEPLSRAVAEAQADYNETMERARSLAGQISETAQEAFDARSERWQDSDTGIQVRSWIEQWEISLDDVDLELPEALEEIDPEEHAAALESGPGRPAELEHTH